MSDPQVVRGINTQIGLQITADPRANVHVINPESTVLDAPCQQLQGTVQNAGITPYYTKNFATSGSLKSTVDDNGNAVTVDASTSLAITPAVTGITITLPQLARSVGATGLVTSGTTKPVYRTVIAPNTISTLPVYRDGSTGAWTNITLAGSLSAITNYTVSSIGWAGGYFYCIFWRTGANQQYWGYSADGITFTTTSFGGINVITSMEVGAYDGTYWYCIDGSAGLLYRTNTITVGPSSGGMATLNAANQRFKMVLCNGVMSALCNQTLYTSTAWTTGQVTTVSTGGALLYSIDSNGSSVVVLVDSSAIYYYSANGTTYTTKTFSVSPAFPSLIYANGYYLTVYQKSVATSLDGLTWSIVKYSTSTVGNGYYALIPYITGVYVTTSTTAFDFISYYGAVSITAKGIQLSTSISRLGLLTYGVSYYDDIYIGDFVYGLRVTPSGIVVDKLDALTFQKSSTVETLPINLAQRAFFARNVSTGYYVFVQLPTGTALIDGGIAYNFSSTVYQTAIYLGTPSTRNFVLGNEVVASNSVLYSGTYYQSFDLYTYTYNTGTHVATAGTKYAGAYYVTTLDGTVVATGKDGSTANRKTLVFAPAGTVTVVDDTATSSVDCINGIVQESITVSGSFTQYSLIPEFKAYAGASLTPAQTATYAGQAFVYGYGSIIDKVSFGGTRYLLRAVYSRGLYSCPTLSITVGNNYIGRVLDVDNVDMSYHPQFLVFASRIYVVYRNFGGRMQYIVIDNVVNLDRKTYFTKIASNQYLLNTIDIYNLIDTGTSDMYVSGVDYNGAVYPNATINYRSKIVNDYYESDYNALAGYVIGATDSMPTPNYQGCVFTTNAGMLLSGSDPRYNSVYVYNKQLLPTSKFNNEAYLDDHNYSSLALSAQINNYFVYQNGLCYSQQFGTQTFRPMNIDILQQCGGLFPEASFFQLYSTPYMYDGENLYTVNVSNLSMDLVCKANGFDFIANSTTVAYFFSYAENAVYFFDGGRAMQKFSQFNAVFPFDTTTITGTYSLVNSALVMFKNSKSIIIDQDAGKSIVSSYIDDEGILFWFTRNSGIYYTDGIGSVKQFAFFPLTGLSSRELIYQSAFFKMPEYIYGIQQILIYIKNNSISSPIATSVAVTLRTFDNQNTYTDQVQSFVLDPAIPDKWFDSSGYTTLKLTPIQTRVYGFSVVFDCLTDISIFDISVAMNKNPDAVVNVSDIRSA